VVQRQGIQQASTEPSCRGDSRISANTGVTAAVQSVIFESTTRAINCKNFKTNQLVNGGEPVVQVQANNQPSWDGSFKPTLLKDSMTHRGHINQKKAAVHCLDVSKVCEH
jgi:hypothetical protein